MSVFDIPFQIPYDGAVETVTLRSTITFKELRRVIARTMDMDVDELKVGYKFSTDARAKAVNHLSTASHLRALVDDAIAILRSSRGTQKKRQKSFKVEIISLVTEEKHRKHEKTRGKKVSLFVKSYWLYVSRNTHQQKKGKQSINSRGRGASSSDEDSALEAIDDPKERSESQWVSRIQKANLCAEHRDGKQACATLPGGTHGQLTKEDLSMWGLLCKVRCCNIIS